MYNCSASNEGLDSVRVICHHGENGGLPQSFVMEVYETKDNKLKVYSFCETIMCDFNVRMFA